jgi:4-hydroxy-3-methylbut-2-enyl diphosphate reductase
VDDTRAIIEVLRRRFPAIVGPSRDDICYATQNRQAAVKRLGAEVELVLVLGAANSSNARRLREVAAAVGAPAHLINDVRDIRPEWMTGIRRIGVTAGASTPEFLVREVVTFLQGQGATAVRELNVVEEDVRFGLPHELMELSRQSGR